MARRYEDVAVELSDVLQPYGKQEPYEEEEWTEEEAQDLQYDPMYTDQPEMEDYSEEEEEADFESRFHIAMGAFDLISILVGVAVILLLVAMLVLLFQWLKADILNSALLVQSGLQ